MTLANAILYVSRPVGGAGNPEIRAMAAEAIQEAYSDWQIAKFWTFLLKDTSATTAISGLVTKTSATVTPTTAGQFDCVNIGQTVTYAGVAGTLAAASVASFVRGTDGVITSITLDVAFGGGSYTTETGTLTFSANIPLIAGTREYNLPNDFGGAHGARLLDGEKNDVDWIDIRQWDKGTGDQTLQGNVSMYTTYNPASEGGQNFGTSRMRVFKTPNAARTLELKYFRLFNTSATSIDVPDQYLYQFLKHARSIIVANKIAMDNPEGLITQAAQGFSATQVSDEQPNDDEDGDARLKSPYEQMIRGPIVGNGEFWPEAF